MFWKDKNTPLHPTTHRYDRCEYSHWYDSEGYSIEPTIYLDEPLTQEEATEYANEFMRKKLNEQNQSSSGTVLFRETGVVFFVYNGETRGVKYNLLHDDSKPTWEMWESYISK